MNNQEEKSTKETLRAEKLKAEEVILLAREQARTRAYLAREQEIANAQQIKDKKRAEQRAKEEIEELAREKARKEAYIAQEKTIAEDQEARKLKNKKADGI
jgi:hypothetical protein